MSKTSLLEEKGKHMNMFEQMDAWNSARREGRMTEISRAGETTQLEERTPRISLRQWQLFHAVIDHGGFVGAANKLHVSQSSISHALAKLQDQLGIPLLTLKGRKAQITEAGKTLLPRSRDLLREASQLEALGEFMRLGDEPEVRLVVEPNYPVALLMRTYNDLCSQSAKFRLKVNESGLAEIQQLMHQDGADLAISTRTFFGLASNKLIELELVAITRADSPLFKNRSITREDLQGLLQIVLCAGEQDVEPLGFGRTTRDQPAWRVNSLDSAADALRFGLGYAWLPRYRVQSWLDDGWVRVLPLDCGASYTVQMYLTRGRAVVPGSSAQRFADALQTVTNEHATRAGSLPTFNMASAVHEGAPNGRQAR